jgi:hypothetical protein
LGLILLLCCALFIACGDDDDDDSDATETGAPTEASATGQASEPAETDEPSATAEPTETDVSATLSEYEIVLGADSAPAGVVNFEITNEGEQQHVFGIVDTDLAEDELPVTDDGVFDPAGGDAVLIANTPGMSAGSSSSFRYELEAGNYVIICTLQTADGQGHLGLGMHAAFTVE